MARKRMITRTIKSRTVTVLGIDIETAEPSNKEVTYTPIIDNPAKELAKVKSLVETDTYKVATIVSRTDAEQILGMTEQFFLEHAELVTRGKANEEIEEV